MTRHRRMIRNDTRSQTHAILQRWKRKSDAADRQMAADITARIISNWQLLILGEDCS